MKPKCDTYTFLFSVLRTMQFHHRPKIYSNRRKFCINSFVKKLKIMLPIVAYHKCIGEYLPNKIMKLMQNKNVSNEILRSWKTLHNIKITTSSNEKDIKDIAWNYSKTIYKAWNINWPQNQGKNDIYSKSSRIRLTNILLGWKRKHHLLVLLRNLLSEIN